MTLAANGDFDQAFELSTKILTASAGATLPVSSPPQDVTSPDFKATVTAKTAIKAIWFRERPDPWRTDSGFGTLKRTTSDVVTMAIKVDVSIDLKEVTMELNGQVQHVDLTKDDKYKPIRKIDFPAYVEITDHVEVQTLDVVKDREAPNVKKTIPCVVIDFNTALGTPSNWPRVSVRIKPSELQNDPAVMLLMAAAEIRDGHGGGDAALAALVNSLSTQLGTSITTMVQSQKTWVVADKGKAILYPGFPIKDPSKTPPNDEVSVKNLEVKTLDDSLFIGIDYLAKRGVLANVGTSTLRGRSARMDDLGTTVSNRMLLRGLIRPVLMKKFGLTSSSFFGGEYCILKAPVSNVMLGSTSITLESLSAFVNDSSQLQIVLSLSSDQAPGVTAHASIDLHLEFAIARVVSVTTASQALRLTTKLANPQTAVVSKNVDVAWWWYVIGALVPTPLGFGIGAAVVGFIDGVVLEMLMASSMAGAIAGFGTPEQDTAAPLPVTLVGPGVELNDPGAPNMPTALGGAFATAFSAHAHDLYIGARFSQLPDPLPVTFQVPDSADPGNRLDGIGGPLTGTNEWALPIDDAIALVEAGHTLTVTVPPAPTVKVLVAGGNGSVPYLKTEKDDFGVNNLGNLPKRILAISSTLGPTP